MRFTKLLIHNMAVVREKQHSPVGSDSFPACKLQTVPYVHARPNAVSMHKVRSPAKLFVPQAQKGRGWAVGGGAGGGKGLVV